MMEAVAHVTKRLNLLQSLPGGPKRHRRNLFGCGASYFPIQILVHSLDRP
jgi:hypothetical protein